MVTSRLPVGQPEPQACEAWPPFLLRPAGGLKHQGAGAEVQLLLKLAVVGRVGVRVDHEAH